MRGGGLLLAILAAGCGGTSSSPTSVMSASFANLQGANTSGVAISSSQASCFHFVPTDDWSCSVTELPMSQGRAMSISFNAFSTLPAPGVVYQLGGAENATLFFKDPTTYGTAMGDRQWQSVAGTGAITIVDYVKSTRIAFSYYGSLQPLGSPATGTFDVTGDGNITNFFEMGP